MGVVVPNHPYRFSAACDGYRRLDRRRWLATTTGMVGGTWMTRCAEHMARAADQATNLPPKSLLMIWLQGGPSQLETFDPHPGTAIGGQVRGIPSSVDGVQVADLMPGTAAQLHLTTLVRSVVSQEGDHERATYHLKTGWRPDPTLVHPAIGAILCHQTTDNLEIPRHISILPSQQPARGGYLGPRYDAFQIGDPAEGIPNLTAAVEDARLERRRNSLLGTLESEFQRGRLSDLDRHRTQHQTATQAAVTMMSSQQLSAFDVQAEDRETRDRFGDTSFGRGCLAAVRLLTTGVRCVEVELDGWDSHINNHQIQQRQALALDKALAATISELDARDLLDNTVVFCGGEFGRTPLINPAGGRDHWPHGFSVLLAGGGFRRGYVHGATNANPDRQLLTQRVKGSEDLARLTDKPITVPDLHATLLRALGLDPAMEMMTPVGRPLRWSDGRMVRALLA